MKRLITSLALAMVTCGAAWGQAPNTTVLTCDLPELDGGEKFQMSVDMDTHILTMHPEDGVTPKSQPATITSDSIAWTVQGEHFTREYSWNRRTHWIEEILTVGGSGDSRHGMCNPTLEGVIYLTCKVCPQSGEPGYSFNFKLDEATSTVTFDEPKSGFHHVQKANFTPYYVSWIESVGDTNHQRAIHRAGMYLMDISTINGIGNSKYGACTVTPPTTEPHS